MNNITNLDGALRIFDEKFNSSSSFCSCMEGDMYDAWPEAKKDLHELITTIWQSSREQAINEIRGKLAAESQSQNHPEYSDIDKLLTKLLELNKKNE